MKLWVVLCPRWNLKSKKKKTIFGKYSTINEEKTLQEQSDTFRVRNEGHIKIFQKFNSSTVDLLSLTSRKVQ